MTERQLKYGAGVFLIILQLVILGSMVVLRFLNGYSTDEFTTCIGIVTPMFSGYATAVIGFLIKDRNVQQDTSRPVTRTFAALVFTIPFLAMLVICAAIWAQAYRHVFDNFEDFKRFVMVFESAFAVYASMLVYAIFDRKQSRSEKTSTRTARALALNGHSVVNQVWRFYRVCKHAAAEGG